MNPHPPYRPDLSPCDFGMFGNLKKFLQGRRFLNDEKVKEAVAEWSAQVGRNFWRNCLYELPEKWKKCIERGGDYVEQ